MTPERLEVCDGGRLLRRVWPECRSAGARRARIDNWAPKPGDVRVEGFARIEGKPGAAGYRVFHSAFVAVIDPQGRLAARLSPPMNPEAIAAFLSALIGQYTKEMN